VVVAAGLGGGSFHFLWGACLVACLPAIHRRIGVATATVAGALLLGAGLLGWTEPVPWQLFVAAMLTGAGWVPLGAAGINAIVSLWFGTHRPMAFAKAYNGASVGGMVFSPLWAVLISRWGFWTAAVCVALSLLAVVACIARRHLSKTPASVGQGVDGLAPVHRAAPAPQPSPADRVHARLCDDRTSLTLSAAMSLGLFAQIGLLTPLFFLLAQSVGTSGAGAMKALASACGMGGRLAMVSLLGRFTDRRRAAAASYAVQALGTAVLWIAGPDRVALLVVGVVLFGLGIGNAT
jgi:Na+/melibiose symporter-like transporter